MNLPAESTAKRSHRLAPFFHAATSATFFAASSAPTPLYRLYQEAFAFSPALISVIFAVYAFSLLVALLLVGSISDHLGRRPVIFASILLLMVAMVLFITATGPGSLIAARIVQGFATGAAASSIGAALIDLDPARGPVVNSVAPLSGMAIGAFGTSALAQFAPAPTLLVYVIVLAVLALAAMLLWTTPETTRRAPGLLASLKPSVAVPPHIRQALLTITPINVSGWMVAGFYLSLIPSLVSAATGNSAPLVGGAVVAVLTVSASTAILLLRTSTPERALRFGVPALGLGVVGIGFGAHTGMLALLLAGTLFAGAGIGANVLGCMRSIMAPAKSSERAGLLSAYYIQSYLAFSLPAIAAGFSARAFGYGATADFYAAALLVITAIGYLALRRDRRRTAEACTV